MLRTRFRRMAGTTLLLASFTAGSAQIRGYWQTKLNHWDFSKDQQNWESIQIPHSCNALDGHSANYYRGKAYYRRTLELTATDLQKPSFLLFEGAAQAAVEE